MMLDGEKKKQLRDHERLKIIKNLVMPVKLSPVKKKKKKNGLPWSLRW